MDSEYYYYCFDNRNLTNCTNNLGENKNEKQMFWNFKRNGICKSAYTWTRNNWFSEWSERSKESKKVVEELFSNKEISDEMPTIELPEFLLDINIADLLIQSNLVSSKSED